MADSELHENLRICQCLCVEKKRCSVHLYVSSIPDFLYPKEDRDCGFFSFLDAAGEAMNNVGHKRVAKTWRRRGGAV